MRAHGECSALPLLEQLIAEVRAPSLDRAEQPATAPAKQASPPPQKQDPPPKHEKPPKQDPPPKHEKKPPPEQDPPPPPKPPPAASASATAAFRPTEPLWLGDSHLFSCSATVLGTVQAEGGGWSVVLDATVFHPQGGGQPGDSGVLTAASGASFSVSSTKKDKSGVVTHEAAAGSAEPPALAAGDTVRCQVDEASRRLAARVHSAGHLIDVGMTACGAGLAPTKGYHFQPGAYVEKTFDLSSAPEHSHVHVLLDFIKVDNWNGEEALLYLDGALSTCTPAHFERRVAMPLVRISGSDQQ